MRGVYLVAARMVAHGLIVSPTSRSAFGADLLATNADCSRAFSIQVKTNRKPASFWLVSEKALELRARSHVYVFVNLRAADNDHEFYVVPSRAVAEGVKLAHRENSTWFAFYRRDAVRYRDKWRLVGGAT
jgi:hypothetical protein